MLNDRTVILCGPTSRASLTYSETRNPACVALVFRTDGGREVRTLGEGEGTVNIKLGEVGGGMGLTTFEGILRLDLIGEKWMWVDRVNDLSLRGTRKCELPRAVWTRVEFVENPASFVNDLRRKYSCQFDFVTTLAIHFARSVQ